MTRLSSILQSFLSRETLSFVADVLSVASFVLALFVLWNVRRLRSAYRLRARGPSLIRDLEKAKSSLTTYLNEYSEAIPEIAAILGRVSVKLRSFERKVSRGPRQTIKRVRLLIDQCEVNAQNEEKVRIVHIELIKVIEELKEHQKDLDWEI